MIKDYIEYIRPHICTLIYHIPPHLSMAHCTPVSRRELPWTVHSIGSSEASYLDHAKARDGQGVAERIHLLWSLRAEEQLYALREARR